MEQKQLNEILDDFISSSKAIELNIATTVTEANNEIEIVLKELLVYLSTTSRNLEKIQDKVETISEKFNVIEDVREDVKELPKKMNDMISDSLVKVIGEFKTINQSSLQLMNAVGAYVKSIHMITKNIDQYSKLQKDDIREIKITLEELSDQVKKTNLTVERNQNNLMSVIKDLLSINDKVKVKEITVEEAKVKADVEKEKSKTEKTKEKYQLIGKIAGLVLGSSGVIYFVVKTLIH
jgi:uncharacterized coiled-coil protein SlyX